jgi:hypothetical protein
MRTSHRTIVLAAGLVAASVSAAFAVPTIDGQRDTDYGTPLFVQTVGTQFGNATAAGGSILQSSGSEINNAHATVANGNLYLFFGGNLESNFNKFDLFIDSRSGGQNQLRGDNPDVEFNNLNRMGFNSATEPGLKFDTGFEADHFFTITNGNFPVDSYSSYAELRTTGGGNGFYSGTNGGLNNPLLDTRVDGNGANPALGIQWGLNNSNILGVGSLGNPNDSDPATVTTGIEIVIPLSYLGDPQAGVKVLAFVNGGGHDFLSNQVAATIPTTQGNFGEPRLVDFSTVTGDQFLSVSVPAASRSVAGATGNWSSTATWSNGVVPNSISSNAYFAAAGTSAISVDAGQTVNSLVFQGGNVTLGGSNTIVVDGTSTAIESAGGIVVVNAPVDSRKWVNSFDIAAGTTTLAGPVTLARGNIQKHGDGTLVLPVTSADNFRVTDGSLKIEQAGLGVQKFAGLDIRDGATLDLGNEAAFFDWTGTGGITDPNNSFAFIKGLVTGGKLVTTAGSAYGVGVVDNLSLPAPITSFFGATVDDTTTLIRATLLGDTDLSGVVDFTDLLAVAQNYDPAGTGKEWVNGDSNYDGIVEFQDLLVVAQNYNLSALTSAQYQQLVDVAGVEFASAFASIVPEPTTLAALAGVTLLGLRRRK